MQEIKNIVNFRDLGGLSGKYGTVKRNKFLRGAHLADITSDDMDYLLNDKELVTVVDLRTFPEKIKQPDLKIPQTIHLEIDIFQEDETAANQTADTKESKFGSNDLKEAYYHFVSKPNYREKFSEFIKVVANHHHGSVFFHCAAGKDRTGFAAAIILRILGIDEQQIFEDYLLTNQLRAQHNEKIMKQIALERGAPLTKSLEDRLQAMLGVKEEYLLNSEKAIADHFNNWDQFIKEGLHLTDEDIQSMRENFLE